MSLELIEIIIKCKQPDNKLLDLNSVAKSAHLSLIRKASEMEHTPVDS